MLCVGGHAVRLVVLRSHGVVVAACVVVMCWLMGVARVSLRELQACEHLFTDTRTPPPTPTPPTHTNHTHTHHTVFHMIFSEGTVSPSHNVAKPL
jgi:hypothetical protein